MGSRSNKLRQMLLLAVIVVLPCALFVRQFHSTLRQNFSLAAVWTSTRQANLLLITLAVLLTYIGYVIRTWRWNVLMQPPGHFSPVLKGTLLGFSAVALLGRPGEAVRPYYISRKESTDLTAQCSVWLLERAMDSLVVLLLIGADLAFSPHIRALASQQSLARVLSDGGLLVLLVVIATVAVFPLLQVFPAVVDRLRLRAAAQGSRFMTGIARLITYLDASARRFKLPHRRELAWSVIHSLALWISVAVAIWVIVRSYPGMLPGFALDDAVFLLAFSLLGSVVQLPGVGGGTQVLMMVGLSAVFHAPQAAAASAALMIWLVSFYAVVPAGLLVAARDGVSWRRLKQEARSSAAAAFSASSGVRTAPELIEEHEAA